MTLRQGCAKVLNDHGAHKSQDLGRYATIRQYRQGFLTYYKREKKTQGIYLSPYIKVSDANPGDAGASECVAESGADAAEVIR